MLKALAQQLHQWINRSATASAWYLRAWQFLLRRLPHGVLKARLIANISLFDWRVERLPPATCRLDGTRHDYRLVPHTGMQDFQASFYRAFPYEPEVVRFLEGIIDDVDSVVEIGANVGLFTLYFSRRLAQRAGGRVFAFEPGMRAHGALLENLAANDARNVQVFNAAVFDRSGTATFYEPTVAAFGYRDLTRSSLIPHHARWSATEVREYEVATMGPEAIEPLLRDHGRILIKLDIEGAERHVLEALRPLLEKYRPGILMEALHYECELLNELAFLPRIYRLLHLTDGGPVEHPRFIGDPQHQFKDYFLSPRPTP